MGELATREQTIAFLERCLDDEENGELALKALNAVLDRWMGKPTQRQELTGPDGGPIATLNDADSPRERIVSQLARIAARRGTGPTPRKVHRGGA